MIARWIGIVLFLLVAIIGGIWGFKKYEPGYFDAISPAGRKVIGIIAIICGIIFAGLIFWNTYYTESGKRAQRDFKSETQVGYKAREVNVYDMEGELIEHYVGKFDTEESVNEGSVKVKFDIDGERHIVYIMSGAVTINDVKENK